MSLDYAVEKFDAAVETLAEGTESIQGRLEDAFNSSIMRVNRAEDIPASQLEAFDSIIRGFSWLDDQSTPPDDDAASALAKEVTALAAALRGLPDDQ